MRHSAAFFGRSRDGRFNAPLGDYGVLYAAEDAHAASLKTFGQSTGINTATTTALSERSLTRIDATQPLKLVDLTGPGLARIGADERLCSGVHEVAQRWAAALWDHPFAARRPSLPSEARSVASLRCTARPSRG